MYEMVSFNTVEWHCVAWLLRVNVLLMSVVIPFSWCLANGVVVNHTIGCPKPMCVFKNGTKVPDGTYYRRNPCEHW